MKSLLRCAPLAFVLAGWFFPACNLETVSPAPSISNPANHLIINEVFTLPESNTHPYSWIEFYNPTGDRIGGLNHWSLTFTYHLALSGVIDTTLRVTANLESFFGNIPDTLEAGQFLVLYGDSIRFYNHTNLGPGKGTVTLYVPFVGSSGGQRIGIVVFLLQEKDELVLRDTSGNAVDVVRYGNYIPPTPDAFPGNLSAGVIPEWSSLSRYAGAYSSGNTANDFYMESKPIPMWYSELNHP